MQLSNDDDAIDNVRRSCRPSTRCKWAGHVFRNGGNRGKPEAMCRSRTSICNMYLCMIGKRQLASQNRRKKSKGETSLRERRSKEKRGSRRCGWRGAKQSTDYLPSRVAATLATHTSNNLQDLAEVGAFFLSQIRDPKMGATSQHPRPSEQAS